MSRYPAPPRAHHEDVLHGVRVEDPYRELEDAASARTKAWVEAEAKYTEAVLAEGAGAQLRAALRQRLADVMNYPRQSAPWRVGGWYLQTKNTGLENQDRLVCRRRLADADIELLNPNELSADGTAALLVSAMSPDGAHLAYQVSKAGSDWVEIRVRSVETRQDLPDRVEWVKFSNLSWSADGRGFYYSRFAAPAPEAALQGVNRHQKLCYHALGTPQSADRLVYERPDDDELGFGGEVTHDGRYLVITGWRGTSPMQQVFIQDLRKPSDDVCELVSEPIAGFHFVGSTGDTLYFRTTLEADRGRLVSMDAVVGLPSLREVIPESKDTLETVAFLSGMFVASYLTDAAASLWLFDKGGKRVRELPLPAVGCLSSTGVTDQNHDEYFCIFESFSTPPTVLRVALPDGKPEVLYAPKTSFDPAAFETRRVFFQSKDGTRIPLFIAHKRGLVLDGDNPTLLYGYGGFGNPVLPWFRMSRLAWMELGGVYASACLRGGGEYGEAWHRAGIKDKKQNVFDDFIAAGKWLTVNGYTNSKRLAINGGSNGGLLVAACMLQEPELFGAVVAAVGVFDMLRFHKFTIGWAWVSDYGSPDDPNEFRTLRAYSPLHNVTARAYPATLITTGDHDDRVVPAHSFKFAATLQAAQTGPAPILLRVEMRAGHGQGKPVGKLIDETADIYAFLCQALGMPRD